MHYSTTADNTAKAEHAARAPKFRRDHLPSDSYFEHQNTEVHGFSISDVFMHERERGIPPRNLIWVGCGGMEGHWLRPEEVLELAAVLTHTAEAHIERVARTAIANLRSRMEAAA